MKPLILAVDFDGTIVKTEEDYVPRELLLNAKEVINWAYDKGCYIILWTCRSGDMLKQAEDFLKSNEVKYHVANKNIPTIDFETSNKIFADLYIDDRNISFTVNWMEIKGMIKEALILRLADEIESLAKDAALEKQAVDALVTTKIKTDWNHYKNNEIEFSTKLAELIKHNHLTINDKGWLEDTLKQVTGKNWSVDDKMNVVKEAAVRQKVFGISRGSESDSTIRDVGDALRRKFRDVKVTKALRDWIFDLRNTSESFDAIMKFVETTFPGLEIKQPEEIEKDPEFKSLKNPIPGTTSSKKEIKK